MADARVVLVESKKRETVDGEEAIEVGVCRKRGVAKEKVETKKAEGGNFS